MKTIHLVEVFILSLIFLASFASADCGMMSSCMVSEMGFLGLIYFALFAFVFSLIFWYTYKLIVKKK